MPKTKEVTAEAVAIDHSTLVLPKPEKIICEVCGHANPEHTSVCKMCSNYLKGMTNT